MQTNKIRTSLLLSLIFAILCSGVILAKPIFKVLANYLSKSEKVHANILLVEGWLPPDAIEQAYKEYSSNGYQYIITTGIRSSEYCGIYMNGYLIFNLHQPEIRTEARVKHRIEMLAYSELGKPNQAHCNFYINDSLVGDFYAENEIGKYQVDWEGKLSTVDSVMIQFDNDSTGDFGDRNLFVKEIIIDDSITIPYHNNSKIDLWDIGGWGKISNDYNSFAQLARNTFLSMGADSSVIIAVPGKRVTLNRTLSSALAFRDWLKTSNFEVKGINIVSEGTHARRTWMTYEKILKPSYNIGIISLPDHHAESSRKYRLFKTVRELIGILYYRLILIPYQFS
jgi:hypothetical protein